MSSELSLNPRTLRILLPAVMIAGLLAFGWSALDQYNINWDEALGDLFFGERYLSYFTSFDPVYLDFETTPYPSERQPDLSPSPFKERPWEYYPVANTLAAATATVLGRWLGLVDVFDGFHAVNLWLGAILIAVFWRFLAARLGMVAATAAIGFLFTAPRIICHLIANIKDFPLMVFYTLTLCAFFHAYEKGSMRGLLGAGLLGGLALGTKANTLFLPAIPLLLIVFAERPEPWRGRTRQLLLTLASSGAVGVSTMVLVWPYLWADPIGRFGQHLRYIGLRQDAMRPESFAPVLEALFFTTPPLFLALFALGLVPCLQRALKRDRLAILLLAWVLVVLGRYLLPQAVNFDGVRHLLEIFPALAAIAGWGVSWLVQQVKRASSLSKPILASLTLAMTLLPGAWAVLSTHPFQIAYWNAFAGGYAGARVAQMPQASDYWGLSYRQGMSWLNQNAEPDAYLAVPVVEHAVRLVAPLRLRQDLLLLPVTTPFSPRIDPRRLQLTREAALERPVYVMFVDRVDWRNALMVDCLRFLEPEVEWSLDGEPVLRIYRYRPPATFQ